MQEFLRSLLRRALRTLFKGVIGRESPESFQRVWIRLVSATTLRARGTSCEQGRWGVPGMWVRRREAEDRYVLLYLHGGGYTLGSAGTHLAISTHIAAASGASVLVPEYRLAPEHPYPAALDDALSAYRHLLDRYPSAHIAIGGDSAGGGLALCLALALRRAGLPPPAALLLLSPWVDLSLSGPTVETLKDADPMLARDWLDRAGRAYRGELAATDPRVSPLFDDLDGLPPTLIQVGSEEILLSDSQRLVERARAIGMQIQLQVEPGLWHDFQLHAGVLKAADAAVARMADFLNEQWMHASKRRNLA